jgi:lipoprotein NlpI
MTTIRRGELMTKLGRLARAESLLAPFEDSTLQDQLKLPYRALFLRINAERHLGSGDWDAARPSFASALEIATVERYAHQIRELERLVARYPDALADMLPAGPRPLGAHR